MNIDRFWTKTELSYIIIKIESVKNWLILKINWLIFDPKTTFSPWVFNAGLSPLKSGWSLSGFGGFPDLTVGILKPEPAGRIFAGGTKLILIDFRIEKKFWVFLLKIFPIKVLASSSLGASWKSENHAAAAETVVGNF